MDELEFVERDVDGQVTRTALSPSRLGSTLLVVDDESTGAYAVAALSPERLRELVVWASGRLVEIGQDREAHRGAKGRSRD